MPYNYHRNINSHSFTPSPILGIVGRTGPPNISQCTLQQYLSHMMDIL